MFFITDEPVLFNIQTGVVTTVESSRVSTNGIEKYRVIVNGCGVYSGTITECQDFIYTLAGWVGAVNPMPKKEAKDESKV